MTALGSPMLGQACAGRNQATRSAGDRLDSVLGRLSPPWGGLGDEWAGLVEPRAKAGDHRGEGSVLGKPLPLSSPKSPGASAAQSPQLGLLTTGLWQRLRGSF